MKQLYHDIPASRGVENAIKRAKRLADISWTPIKPLPCCLRSKGEVAKEYYYGYFTRWMPQKGLPYSSCRTTEKYIGYNVSLETFLSALQNPNSVVYSRELRDQPGSKANCYYGLVCSMCVSYALDLPYRVACKDWPALPSVQPVDVTKLENLQLCDIVLEPKSHIAMITDIQRDADGKVHCIEVCESTLPLAIRTHFTAEEFCRYWLDDGYSVYRYNLIDQVTYTPDPFVYMEGDPLMEQPKINADILPDFGNKANYRIGDEPVELSVLTPDWESIEVTDPDGTVTAYAATEKLVLAPEKPGYYSARLRRGDVYSEYVEWCMVAINLSFEQEKFSLGQELKIRFSNPAPDSVFHYVLNNDSYYVRSSGNFTAEESFCRCRLPARTRVPR